MEKNKPVLTLRANNSYLNADVSVEKRIFSSKKARVCRFTTEKVVT